MATLLDDHLVEDALQGLDGWSGDAQRISRTVEPADAEALVAAVGEAADTLDHHPEVERDGGRVTFVLWTHSQGGVTELDIALASRIDDLLRQQVDGPIDDAGVKTMQPRFEDRTSRPATAADAASGQEPWQDGGGDPGTMHPPADPRQGAGPIVAPDDSPRSAEPQPGGDDVPGMHEDVEGDRRP